MEMAIENIMKKAHLHLQFGMAGMTTCYSCPIHHSLKRIGTAGIETRVTPERIFDVMQQVCGKVDIVYIKLDLSLSGMQSCYSYCWHFWVLDFFKASIIPLHTWYLPVSSDIVTEYIHFLAK